MSDTDSRLSRWSRMKSEARQQTRLRFSVPESETVAPVEAVERPSELPDDELPPESVETAFFDAATAEAAADPSTPDDDPDLPDIDDLDASSDYSAFMSDKVSDTVRNLALRKLWRTDSVFANLDGLIDYGEDFTDAATVVEGMKSVYTVGRGMVDYEAEDAAKLAALEEEGLETEGLEEETLTEESPEEEVPEGEPPQDGPPQDGPPQDGPQTGESQLREGPDNPTTDSDIGEPHITADSKGNLANADNKNKEIDSNALNEKKNRRSGDLDIGPSKRKASV